MKSLAYLLSQILLKGKYKSRLNKNNRMVNVNTRYLRNINHASRVRGINAYMSNLLSRNANNIPINYEAVIRAYNSPVPIKNRYINMIRMYRKNIHPSNTNYRRIMRGYFENMQRVFSDIRKREQYITTHFPKQIFNRPLFIQQNYRNFKNNYIKNIMNTKIIHVGPNKRRQIIELLNKPRSGRRDIQKAIDIYFLRGNPRSREYI